MKTPQFFFCLLVLTSVSCNAFSQTPASAHVDHTLWDQLVHANVNSDGTVNYRGFVDEREKLDDYLEILSDNPPDKDSWPVNERLAFWINAYNAFTVKLIVDNYPVESIKDIKQGIPMVNSVWDIKFIEIGNEQYDLNKIEHGILRKDFDEPRIHFAINCASVSCPALRNEAYTAEKLEAQLESQAKAFLSDPTKNKITPELVEISKIFQWFQGDFTQNQTLIEFLNKYAPIQIKAEALIRYLDYDWSLND